MEQALHRLSPRDVAVVIDVLRAGVDQPGQMAQVPRLHESIRRVLFPEATSRGQQELEARMFLAAAEARHHLGVRPPASLVRPAFAVSSIEPDPQGIRVHLDRYGLGPLLMDLLPQAQEYQVDGVPGLRYRQRRRHVELRLLDTRPQAKIVLLGIDKGASASAFRFVENSYTGPCRWLWQGEYRSTLSLDERKHLRDYRRVYGPAHIASSLFRRHRILAGAGAFSTRGEWNQWKLDWRGGPSPTEVGARLSHPIFGLPGQWEMRYAHDEVAMLHERVSEQQLARGYKPHEVYLFREPPPTPEDEARAASFVRSGWTAWTAWETEEARRQVASRRAMI